MKKKIVHFCEYILVLLLEQVIKIFSLNTVYKFAELIGLLFYYVLRIRKELMYNNIKKVFPEYSEKNINNIIKNNYIKVVKSSFEYFLFPIMNNKNYEKFGWIENTEIIDKELKKKRSVILLGAHFDNPELTANLLKFYGYPIVEFVKKQQNPYINKKFETLRKSNGIEVVYKGLSVRKVFKLLKKGKVLTTVGDISISEDRGIKIDFFNEKIPTPVGPAKIGIRTNSAIIPVFSYRSVDNQHRIKVFDKINYENLDCSEHKKIEYVMTEYNKILEQNICKYPDEWFWLHNRWKHTNSVGK